MTWKRAALLILAVAAVVAGAYLSLGPPQLTLGNTGLRVEYPSLRGFGAIGAGAGATLASFVLTRRWLRVVCAVLAAVALWVGAHLLAYRLDAESKALVARGFLSLTTVPWGEVRRVETGPSVLVVWGAGDTQVRVDTADFQPDQRATLERTIARRVKESRGGQ